MTLKHSIWESKQQRVIGPPYTKAFLSDNIILIPWKTIEINIVDAIQLCFSHREGSTVLYVNSTNRLFILLSSGKRFRSMMAKTERLRKSFFPQPIRLLNSNSVS